MTIEEQIAYLESLEDPGFIGDRIVREKVVATAKTIAELQEQK